MKNSVKYLISTIIFFILYTSIQFLFINKIEWKVTFIATILYGITNTLCQIAFIKKIEKL